MHAEGFGGSQVSPGGCWKWPPNSTIDRAKHSVASPPPKRCNGYCQNQNIQSLRRPVESADRLSDTLPIDRRRGEPAGCERSVDLVEDSIGPDPRGREPVTRSVECDVNSSQVHDREVNSIHRVGAGAVTAESVQDRLTL